MLLAFSVGANAVSAVVLDWSQVTWNTGSPSQTFSDVQGSGIDISISTAISGGNYYSPIQDNGETLVLFPDWSSNYGNWSYIDVTIRFTRTVANVSFSFEDMDRGDRTGSRPTRYAWEDVIEQAYGWNDTALVTPTATNIGSDVLVDTTSRPGDVLYRGNTNLNWSPDGSFTLNWEQPVDTIAFRYSSGSRAQSNPVGQVIGISNISFHSAVPEAGTIWFGALLLAALALRSISSLSPVRKT
ncbi:MAG: hypothetical protein JW706_03995 [Opitutales bacterium]|nr:hypothetical protein [Opitutales bacterium]